MDPRKPIDLNRPPAGHPEQRDHGCASRAVVQSRLCSETTGRSSLCSQLYE